MSISRDDILDEQKQTQATIEFIRSYETDVFHDSLGMRVWELRHQFAAERLSQLKAKKILDVTVESQFKGLLEILNSTKLQSNSFNIFSYYIFSFISVQDGIDIDEDTLRNEAAIASKPDCFQNLYSYQREQQLIVSLYKGSALNKNEFLKRQNYDAITMIEVIEHLQQNDLYLLEQNLFGYLRPNHVIITTPNSDFNVYFKMEFTLNYSLNREKGQKFRDSDHKFEWSRSQFTQWAESIKRFGIFETLILKKYSQIICLQKDTQFQNKQEQVYIKLIKIQMVTVLKQQYFKKMKTLKDKQTQLNYISNLYNQQNLQLKDLQEQSIELIVKYPYPFESREDYFRKYIVTSILYLISKSEEQLVTDNDNCETYVKIEQLMQNEYIRDCPLIDNNFYNLKQYLETFKQFIIVDDQEDIKCSKIMENYNAKVEVEDNDQDEEHTEAPSQNNNGNDSSMEEEFFPSKESSKMQYWNSQQLNQINSSQYFIDIDQQLPIDY